MHLILTGATGLVGSAVLRAMLRDPAVTRVSILARRPVPQADGHAKAEVILHHDFGRWEDASEATLSTATPDNGSTSTEPASSSLRAKLASASGVVWALGISQNLVSATEYEAITHDYALAFVRFWARLQAPRNAASSPDPTASDASALERTFVFVSGEGAAHRPSIFTARYGRVKGRTELELLEMTVPPDNNDNASEPPSQSDAKTTTAAAAAASAKEYIPNLTIYAPRPAAVDPTAQPEIKPFLPIAQHGLLVRIAMPVFLAMTPLLNALWPNALSPTTELGTVLTELAKGRRAELVGLRSETKATEPGRDGKADAEADANELWTRFRYAEQRGGKASGKDKDSKAAVRAADARHGWRGGVLANGELRRLAGLPFNR